MKQSRKGSAHRVQGLVRALRHRSFRTFFFTMLISFVGTWMQSLAQSWLVYRLTGSAWLLGVVGFAGQVPILLLAPFAGVIADRHNRRKIVIATQALSMAQAFVLAFLTITGMVSVEAIMLLAVLLGVLNAFDLPARQSLMVELVGKEDLMNAIALNSSMINGARIVGPALAGLLVAWLGEGVCFLINGASYVAVILGLLTIRTDPHSAHKPAGSTLSNLIDGFSYVMRTRSIRTLLMMVALVSLCGLPYMVLMPIFTDQVLGGGPKALGTMIGAAGVGALGGALTIAARHGIHGLARVIGVSVVAFGGLLLVFAFSRSLILSTLVLIPIGFTLMLQMPATNTLLQTIVPDRMRGRVMSFYSMSLIGIAPFGSLIAGIAASHIGAPNTLASGALICLGGAAFFLLRVSALEHEESRVAGLGSTPSSAIQAETSPLDSFG